MLSLSYPDHFIPPLLDSVPEDGPVVGNFVSIHSTEVYFLLDRCCSSLTSTIEANLKKSDLEFPLKSPASANRCKLSRRVIAAWYTRPDTFCVYLKHVKVDDGGGGDNIRERGLLLLILFMYVLAW